MKSLFKKKGANIAGFLALPALLALYLATRPLCIHVSDSYAWVNTVETESFGFYEEALVLEEWMTENFNNEDNFTEEELQLEEWMFDLKK